MNWRAGIDLLRLMAFVALRTPRLPARASVSFEARLAAFPTSNLPLEKPGTIRWNARGVAFAEAVTDRDAAVQIGLVHGHLRLGQIELMRRLARGRLSELIGGAGLEIDHTLRIIDFGRPVPAMMAALPAETHAWLEGYVAGLNHVLFNTALPHEFAVFELEREPWTVADILTIGRLFAFDIAWLVWRRLFQLGDPSELELRTLSAINNRAGSNALAIGRPRTAGAAWLACDPHLGLSLPSTWLVMGYRAPSHAAVGLMIPGMPFVAVGRNEAIAWGGTNLHALASDMVDVSHLAASDIESREERVAVRWGRTRTISVRSCRSGPVLSDSSLFRSGGRVLALRWMGHRTSDETSALLALGKATDWTSFNAALRGFAVPGLNMVYADREGHIGHALACWIPKGRGTDDLVCSDTEDWQEVLKVDALPSWYDPERGFIASANEKPDCEVPVGRFFSSGERATRLHALLKRPQTPALQEVARSQLDVVSDDARALAHALCRSARAVGPGTRRCRHALSMLESWTGSYDRESEAAALFELLLFHFARAYYRPSVLGAYAATWALRDLISRDVAAAPPEALGKIVVGSLKRAVRRRRGRKWGELHRLRLEHPLAAVPLAGRRYRFLDAAADGGSETLLKTANPLISGRHAVRFGSNARFVTDLSGLDENHFVLLGGQDGWFGSVNFLDQVPIWQRGEYMRVPLSPDGVRKALPYAVALSPRGKPAA